jgi:CubicO group peptidase (beta-lactamase class C family)
MKNFLAVFLLVAGCASAPQHNYTSATDAARAHVDGVITRGRIPGAAIAVTVGDRMVWHDTFGVADIDAKTPVTIHTRFRIGSVTKMITLAALMQLVGQGRMQLDDPVSKYLPAFPHGEITLRQLATHHSGIRHYGPGEFMNTRHYASATESLSRFANDPLLFTPGEKYSYSTYGYNVLAAVIESVTGKTFDEAVRMLVFAPARMHESGFTNNAQTTRFYAIEKEKPVLAPEVDLSDRLGGGAILSTARDLARFLMTIPDSSIGWRSAVDEKGRTFIHHGGQSSGGRTFVLLYPRERVGVAFVSNLGGAPFDEKNAAAIAAGFLPELP